ncbi:MAG: acyl-CoA thioesterase [Acidobacteria bacterium]|nr:acyl-CoA thioesterase [Acidobacteriota bacterium]
MPARGSGDFLEVISMRVPVQVHFDEADPRGVLFFGRILTLAHRLFEEHVVPRLVTRWEDWFASEELAVPIRHAEASFSRPMRPGVQHAAEIEVAEVGATSFTVRTRFLEAAEGTRVCAETRVTHVFVEGRTWAKREIPPEIRARLESLRAGTTATPAAPSGISPGPSGESSPPPRAA